MLHTAIRSYNLHTPLGAFAMKNEITQPSLPWAQNALEPVISEKTLSFHYGKHHAGYGTNLNKLIEGTPLEGKSLVEIILMSANKPEMTGIFNNAAQFWNHSFYWESLSPKGGGKPTPAVLSMINDKWGSLEDFNKTFLAAAGTQFGSGWAWLVYNTKTKELDVIKTANALTPISDTELVPLAVLDVWEHAYYLDYQNRRPDYAKAVLDKLFNWQFVDANLKKVT